MAFALKENPDIIFWIQILLYSQNFEIINYSNECRFTGKIYFSSSSIPMPSFKFLACINHFPIPIVTLKNGMGKCECIWGTVIVTHQHKSIQPKPNPNQLKCWSIAMQKNWFRATYYAQRNCLLSKCCRNRFFLRVTNTSANLWNEWKVRHNKCVPTIIDATNTTINI